VVATLRMQIADPARLILGPATGDWQVSGVGQIGRLRRSSCSSLSAVTPSGHGSGPTVACAPPQDYAAANAAQVAAARLEMYLKRSWNVIPPGGRAGSSATSRSK
jgi:hypothetical protein